jgi:hypothetical protein
VDVKDIVSLLATLSIGLDEPGDSDIVVFMQYINLCYFELLQETISQSPFVEKLNVQLDCTDGVLDAPYYPIFIPKHVYDIALNVPLTATLEDDVLKQDPGLTKTGTPQSWYYANGVINVYPLTTSFVGDGAGFGLRYIKEPDPLEYSTTSSLILIPKMYQQILADGASYYLFQSETGFKDQLKMQAAMMRWKEGKQKLFSYMKNVSGKKNLSTFSVV